jgi:hypothetical protein
MPNFWFLTAGNINKQLDKLAQARIVQTVFKSRKSILSGLRCWRAYCMLADCQELPAEKTQVRRWMSIFNNGGTAANYLAALKKAHFVANLDVTFDTPDVRNIIKGIYKANGGSVRPRQRIRVELLLRMVKLAMGKGLVDLADIWIISYWFMLRVPSEALKLQFGTNCIKGSRAFLDNGVPTLFLHSRKNAQKGATLKRSCCCNSAAKIICPHLVIARRQQQGRKDWKIPYQRFLRETRKVLTELQVQDAMTYGSHSFRRGCADDLRASGASLRTILEAGGWKSGAFQAYISMTDVENDAVAQIVLDYSEDEGETTLGESLPINAFRTAVNATRKRAAESQTADSSSTARPSKWQRITYN